MKFNFNLGSTNIIANKVKSNLDLIPIQCILHYRINDLSLHNLDNIITKLMNNKLEPVIELKKLLHLRNDYQGFQYNYYQRNYSNCRGYLRLLKYSNTVFDTNSYHTSNGYLKGNQYVGVLNQIGNKYYILYNLCVKEKYVKYFVQCVLLNKEIDNRIFTLVIDKEFDCPQTYAHLIRPNFRKYVKKHYAELGIDIEYRSKLDEYFFTKYKLQASTPMELKQIKKDLVQELLTI